MKVAVLLLLAHVVAASFEGSLNTTSHWTQLQHTNRIPERNNAWGCVLGDYLYVFGGGGSDGEFLGDFWRFSFLNLTWYEPPVTDHTNPHPSPREKHKMVCDEPRDIVYILPSDDEGTVDMWAYHVGSGTWEELPLTPTFDPVTYSTDYIAVSTPEYILVAGSEAGDYSYWCAFHKDNKTWLTGNYDGIRLEDPGGIAIGSVAYILGGSIGSASPELGHRFDLADVESGWTSFEIGIFGEEWRVFNPFDEVLLIMGDAGGKGPIANNDVAMWNTTLEVVSFTVVNRTDGWIPILSEFMSGMYKGKIVVVGGVSERDNTEYFHPNVYVFNPTFCLYDCSGSGTCVLGNCQCDASHSGIGCEVDETVTTEPNLLPILLPVVLGILIIAAGIVWKATSNMRAYRKMYNNTRVAEVLADSIARMALEELDYLQDITHPTKLQGSFLSIVAILKTYKLFIPDPILQSARGMVESGDSPLSNPLVRASFSKAAENATEHMSSFPSRSAVSKTDSEMKNSFESGGKKRNSGGVAQVLMAKVESKTVSMCVFKISDYREWVERQQLLSHEVSIFADAVQNVVELTRGSILEACLSVGSITCAWNFQIRKCSPEFSAAEAAVSYRHPGVTKVITKGKAICGMLGGTSFRVPVLIGHLWGVTEVLFKVAMKRGIPVTTNIKSLSEMYPLAPVDIIVSSGLVSRSECFDYVSQLPYPIAVFSVELIETTSQSEWMYQLDAIQSTNARYMPIMTAYESAGSEAASHLLRSLEDSKKESTSEQQNRTTYICESLGIGSVSPISVFD